MNTSTKQMEQLDKQMNDDILIYRDNHLVSGTLRALILHMVPNGQYSPDSAYLFAFLLSSRLFISPHELLEKVYETCELQQKLSSFKPLRSVQVNDNCLHFSRQMIDVLRQWIETFPYDFRDDRVMHNIRLLTQKCMDIDDSLAKECSKIMQNLLSRLKILENYEDFFKKINSRNEYFNHPSLLHPRDPKLDKNSSNTLSISLNQNMFTPGTLNQRSGSNTNDQDLDFLEFLSSPLHLAHQLTHIELERLYHIGPEEFVQAFAKENLSESLSFRNGIKKTKNLECYIHWFNRLSYLVASETVRHIKKKQRVRIIEFWIETARECFNIGNFNSLMAILAGLNMSPVLRLKKTVRITFSFDYRLHAMCTQCSKPRSDRDYH